MINGFLRFKSFKLSTNTIDRWLSKGVEKHQLTSVQCGALLQSFTNTKSVGQGKRLHAYTITSGLLFNNTYLCTKLAALYASFGEMVDAGLIFDRIVLKSSFLWNVMIRGYANSGLPEDALVLFGEMICFGQKADNFTYPFVLKACGDLLMVRLGREVHCQIVVRGFEHDLYVANSLLAMYMKFGEVWLSRQLFDKMSVRDLTSWNIVISGYAQNGYFDQAISVFRVMEQATVGQDRVTFLSLVAACANLSDVELARQVHGRIVGESLEYDAFVRNSLIDMYCKCGFLVGAVKLFEGIVDKDVVSWNSIIAGCVRNGEPVRSFTLFRRMRAEIDEVDQATLTSLISACNQLTALHCARCIHAYIIEIGFGFDITLGTSVVDMYAKCGSVEFARQVFDEIPTRNLFSWSAIIAGYGLHGRGKDSLSFFEEMKHSGIKPDGVTCLSVLAACSHAGLVDEGREIFEKMSSEYSVVPQMEHYICFVDLLGRVGRLEEAYDFIESMKMEPSIDVWASLLSACRTHNNMHLAEAIADKIFHLKPKGIGAYVALSNIYASARRWKDAEVVRAILRQRKLKKPPGYSFVELNRTVHWFLVGDRSHPQSEEIYAKLADLRIQMKEAGYKPDTSSVFYDVEDDVKEKMLECHSERLAIGFVLINTRPGTPIRIAKNLRVCNDCHSATKLISKLVGREIIVRDARRFHHFINGSCSCGDYW
ncbi:putative pentatricopeptide repeat-containing protein [Nymphaea thermarum]|nr:putative pentatricopeptide repeat-containing protein [Nymphaea thermarum]